MENKEKAGSLICCRDVLTPLQKDFTLPAYEITNPLIPLRLQFRTMESDNDYNNQSASHHQNNNPSNVHRFSLVAKWDIAAYMQHITDVCDPPQPA